ncbi:hypothetical protein ABWU93_11580 [Xanthomonas translucens pv. translucens]|uniref:hypothetical protein n=1 Tax=Xanthomonas campestris pv. translucens TaxID=343 RepID=UPI003F7246B2
MRAIPDRWNPRLWLRDWLCRSTPTERAAEYEQLSSRVVAALEADVRKGTSVLNRTAPVTVARQSSGDGE